MPMTDFEALRAEIAELRAVHAASAGCRRWARGTLRSPGCPTRRGAGRSGADRRARGGAGWRRDRGARCAAPSRCCPMARATASRSATGSTCSARRGSHPMTAGSAASSMPSASRSTAGPLMRGAATRALRAAAAGAARAAPPGRAAGNRHCGLRHHAAARPRPAHRRLRRVGRRQVARCWPSSRAGSRPMSWSCADRRTRARTARLRRQRARPGGHGARRWSSPPPRTSRR